MRGEGRGDRLGPIAFAGAAAVLVNPGVAVSTAAVFGAWDGVDRGALDEGDALTAARAGRNDLEPPARRIAPATDNALTLLGAQPGAGLVRMSGSGATCFGLFADAVRAAAAGRAIAAAQPGWWVASANLLAS